MRKSIKAVFIGLIIFGGLNLVGCESTEGDYVEDINDTYTDAFVDTEASLDQKEAVDEDTIQENVREMTKEEPEETVTLSEEQFQDMCNSAYNQTHSKFLVHEGTTLEGIIKNIENSMVGIELTSEQLNLYVENVVLAVYDADAYVVDENGSKLNPEEAIHDITEALR